MSRRRTRPHAKRTMERTSIRLPRGYRSDEVGSFVAQLDDQNALLLEDLRGIRPAEISWQPAPGVNTIGMLLAHIAIVEVFWIQMGPLRRTREAVRPVLGIGINDDGIPLPPGRPAPKAMAGKSLAFYRGLLKRARAYTAKVARPLEGGALESLVRRRRRDGSTHEYNLRWVLYHMVEHQAGHYGQILLLRHLYRHAIPPVRARRPS